MEAGPFQLAFQLLIGAGFLGVAVWLGITDMGIPTPTLLRVLYFACGAGMLFIEGIALFYTVKRIQNWRKNGHV